MFGEGETRRKWRLRAIVLLGSALAACLVGCGPSSDDGGPPRPTSVPVDSLPVVDLSEEPDADSRDPAERAGAAASFLDCTYEVWSGGWVGDMGPMGAGDDPDGVIDDLIDTGIVGLPLDGLVARGRDQGRVLYTYEVDGSAKLAAIVADTESIAIDSDLRWGLELYASCDPAEFEALFDDQLPMKVWTDAEGERVPVASVMSFRGPEHCGWESATFLSADGVGYVADPDGVLPAEGTRGTFEADTELPVDAVDTGYRDGDRQLWVSEDRSTAFLVDGDEVQALPASTDALACA